ncbi:sigma-70 family RNA polymerase sigma factor [Paenibacillus cymbidii]|uniref:sigma-70 family RNA polymerase sigma factor n=1 Tax=Paenibacillus cymbidii TaxID=1639034 RepID=UPI00107FEF3A|nr:sigma-70 family RNA polymerase sigma factor [Paenibacillus cymbidii]
MNVPLHEQIAAYQETESEELLIPLLRQFESMVKMAAGKMSRNRPDLYDDLTQVGSMSLLRLFKQFDASYGIPFEAYAMKSLIGHMKNYLRDKAWYVQVPRRIKEKGLLVQQAIDTLTMELERSPRVGEIAERLELSEEETIQVLAGRECYQYVSLDTPLSGDESGSTIGDLIGSRDDEYATVDNRLDIQAALGELKEEEQQVIQLVFAEGRSQRSIADALGISQMSVSRIQKRALDKLRGRLLQDREERMAADR